MEKEEFIDLLETIHQAISGRPLEESQKGELVPSQAIQKAKALLEKVYNDTPLRDSILKGQFDEMIDPRSEKQNEALDGLKNMLERIRDQEKSQGEIVNNASASQSPLTLGGPPDGLSEHQR